MLFLADSGGLAHALILAALFSSVAILWWLGVPLARIRDRLADRFIWGVPWGSLIVVGGLLGIYLFVQRGFWHWNNPVIVSYMASSMGNPLGWLLAAFSHTSPSHLRGNLTTTLVFAPLAEYIWGHYPRSRQHRWEPDWARRPGVRAVVLFPLAVGVVGVLSVLFSWGPVIGFSVAVYALIGFTLMHFPLLTLAALIARGAVRVLWSTLTDPVVIAQTTIRAVRPGFVGSAVQGHLVGFLIGVAVGIALLRYQDARPSAGRLWLSAVLVGLFLSMWELWWILGPETFILLRGVGVALVFVVATVITLAATRPDALAVELPVDLRRAAVALLLVSILAMGAVSIGINLTAVEPPDRPVAASAGDFDIYYGENIPDGMVNVVDVELFGLTTDVRTSGVVVVSEQRGVWYQAVSASQLEARGQRSFYVGGLGWSERITSVRIGWVPTGNASVYQVWVGHDGEFTQAFAAAPRTAEPVVAGHEFAIEAGEGAFYLNVTHAGESERLEVPSEGENVTVHEVTIQRENNRLFAEHEDTRVRIAKAEEAPGRS